MKGGKRTEGEFFLILALWALRNIYYTLHGKIGPEPRMKELCSSLVSHLIRNSRNRNWALSSQNDEPVVGFPVAILFCSFVAWSHGTVG